MKKIMNLVLSLVLVFALAGCGAEQTATYVMTQTQEGMAMTDTQTFNAKGDLVYQMKKTATVDFSAVDESVRSATMELVASTYEEMCENPPAGVTASCVTEGDVITVDITINFEDAEIKELVDSGYLYTTTDENGNFLAVSFKQSCAGLEAAGYTAQE